ncbi:MAG: M48 family metalloprotease [Chloroflexota bacterium]
MKVCHYCQTQNRAQARFCNNCGQMLPLESLSPEAAEPGGLGGKRPFSTRALLFSSMTLIALVAIGFLAWSIQSGSFAFLATPTPTPSPIEAVATRAQDTVEAVQTKSAEVLGETDVVEAAEEQLESLQEQASDLAGQGVEIAKTRAADLLGSDEEGEETAVPDTNDPERGEPIPGSNLELPRLGDEQEVEIGRQTDLEIRAQYPVADDPEAMALITDIGWRIVPYSDRPDLPYSFTVLETDEINAFAVPGGYIYVTRGMLNFVGSNDELASVIAHEIAHVGRRHGARRVEVFTAAEFALELITGLSDDMEQVYEDRAAQIAAHMASQVLFSGWSRTQEFEADEYGVIYLAAAGYEPEAAVSALQRMHDTFDQEFGHPVEHLLDTHPPFSDRIRHVQETIAANDL